MADVNISVQDIVKILCPKCTKALKELIAKQIADSIISGKK